MSVGVDKEAAFSTYTGRRGCGYAAVYVRWGGGVRMYTHRCGHVLTRFRFKNEEL